MNTNKELSHRKATLADLPHILALLKDDTLGQTRESQDIATIPDHYIIAFNKISLDPNHYLMVVEGGGAILGTCHLTLLPSLTFEGSTRLQIEAVRVHSNYRNQKIGSWMMQEAMTFANKNGATMIQLTTNKLRPEAKQFYERLGFVASHEGMKLSVIIKK
jgi:GNAT superfamily N-acetyltransferase